MRRNNIMKSKKIIAGILGAAMLCSVVPVAGMMMPVNYSSVTAAETQDSLLVSADFENGENPFTRRGENEVLTVTSDAAHSGSNSLCVSERIKNWNGPQIALDDIINTGEEYVVSAAAMTKWYSTVTLSKQYTDSDGNIKYENVQSKVSQGEWVEFSDIKISFPAGTTDKYIYFESNDAKVDMYIDDFTLSNAPEVDIEDIPGIKDVYNGYFKVGTSIMASNLSSKPFMKLVEKHFNQSITPGNELKPDAVLDKNASLALYESDGDDTNPQVTLAAAKPILEYCQENNIPLRGHTLVWHSQTPDWFFKEGYSDSGAWVSKEKMIERMENYIKNVMNAIATEYPDLDVYAWDVVNEAWTDNGTPRTAGSNNVTPDTSAWVQVFGDNSFIEYAFKFARQYAPEGTKLYYNDFNEYMTSKTNAIVNMATELKEKGLIDGIGMQSHLDVSFPSASAYKTCLEKFAATGLDIQITELDVTTGDTTESGLQKQADYYSDIFDAIVEYKDSISAVVLWGVTDDQSWRAAKLPLLFDAEYKAKPAYYSITDGIEPVPTEPTTEPETDPTEPTGIIPGDVKSDGVVNAFDAVALRNILMNDFAVLDPHADAADTNGDGFVTTSDLVLLCKYLTGDKTAELKVYEG